MTGGVIPKGLNTIIPIEQIIFYPNKKNPRSILIDKKIKKNFNMLGLKVQILREMI